MKLVSTARPDIGDRIIVLRDLDRLRKWDSLDDRRFCRCCHKFISGRQIEIVTGAGPGESTRLICPTTNCSGKLDDWVYPNELAQPPDSSGRRAIRVIDKNGERFIVCGRPHSHHRRQNTQKFALGAKTAA